MGKMQFEVMGQLVKDFTRRSQHQIDSDSTFFGCCEFQALLQRTDAALKIELDGNDLGAGALILALALKFCQASDENNWIECRLLNFVTKKVYACAMYILISLEC